MPVSKKIIFSLLVLLSFPALNFSSPLPPNKMTLANECSAEDVINNKAGCPQCPQLNKEKCLKQPGCVLKADETCQAARLGTETDCYLEEQRLDGRYLCHGKASPPDYICQKEGDYCSLNEGTKVQINSLEGAPEKTKTGWEVSEKGERLGIGNFALKTCEGLGNCHQYVTYRKKCPNYYLDQNGRKRFGKGLWEKKTYYVSCTFAQKSEEKTLGRFPQGQEIKFPVYQCMEITGKQTRVTHEPCPGGIKKVIKEFPNDTSSKCKVDLIANGSDGPLDLNHTKKLSLTWITENAETCTASGDWSGRKPTYGSKSFAFLEKGENKFILNCSGKEGRGSDSVIVNSKEICSYSPAVEAERQKVLERIFAETLFTVADSTLCGKHSCDDNSPWSVEELLKFEQTLYKLPNCFLNSTGNPVIMGRSDQNPVYAEVWKEMCCNANNIAGYLCLSHDLVMCDRAYKKYNYSLEGVLSHELTHAIQHSGGKSTIPSQAYGNPLVIKWLKKTGWDPEGVCLPVIGCPGTTLSIPEDLPTEYAKKTRNPLEDMAESVRLYVVGPQKLLNISPRRYNFVRDDLMCGEEYK